MYSRRKGFAFWLCMTLMLVFVLVASVACWGSPTFKLIVENQTEYDLNIYVNGVDIGKVSPEAQIIKTGIPWDIGRYHIEAKNTEGEIIHSKTFTFQQMIEIESRVYKVVIPHQDNGSGNSENITGEHVVFRTQQYPFFEATKRVSTFISMYVGT